MNSVRLLFLSFSAAILIACGSGKAPVTDTPVTTVPSPAAPSVPAGLAAKAGDKQLEITWTKDAAVSKYNLYHSANANVAIGAGGVSQVANVTTPYTLGSLTNGSAHSVALTAENAEGKESVLSSIVTATPALPVPETVVCNGNLDATYNISTFAGSGLGSLAGLGGLATAAKIGTTRGLTSDSAGNIYIATNQYHRVLKVDKTTNIITSVIGNGASGNAGDGGLATAAQINNIWGLSIDENSNLHIGEPGNDTVRKVDNSTGIITKVSGTTSVPGNTGDGGLATAARHNEPIDMEFDANGNLFVADWQNHAIRRIDATTGIITTIAGTLGTAGSTGDGGAAASALLNNPFGLAFDSSGNLYVSEWGNRTVRKIDMGTGIITRVAGTTGLGGATGDGGLATSATLSSNPSDIMVDGTGNIIIADASNHAIRLVEAASGNIKTIAGTIGSAGFSGDGGAATSAQFNTPYSLACSGGKIFVSDSSNRRVRVLTPTP